jgi:hypothetical protein
MSAAEARLKRACLCCRLSRSQFRCPSLPLLPPPPLLPLPPPPPPIAT